jgi:hypothetical protein
MLVGGLVEDNVLGWEKERALEHAYFWLKETPIQLLWFPRCQR